jgi:adenine-specific DNA-methyltransferase
MSIRQQKGNPVSRIAPDFFAERIEEFERIFPEAVTEGKIDFDKLKMALGEEVDGRQERYSFAWAGKKDAIRLLQVPSRATLAPFKEESINFDTTHNIFIEGDNLEVLKLLWKPYFGRVKMIYIDPPYNTGNDFIYNDNFADPLDSYLKLTGQKDLEGNLLTSNPQTSGRYHSSWLSMMYPRLFLARQLMTDNGLIFVSIDDNEVHNLRLLMNEIFGEQCFKNCIVFGRGMKSVQAQFDTVDALTVGHEYVLMYAKSPEARFKKLSISLDEVKSGGWNNHWRGTDRPTMRYELLGTKPTSGQWRWSKDRSLKAIENYNEMLSNLDVKSDEVTQAQIDNWYAEEIDRRGKDIDLLRLSPMTGKPEHYIPPSESRLGSDLWTDLSTRGSTEVKNLFGRNVFDNPKPTALLKRMLDFATEPQENAIVLDFMAGTCSTAHAVFEINRQDQGNRKFIMIQLPEPSADTEFHTIAEIGKERIRRVIKRMNSEDEGKMDLRGDATPEDLGFKIFRLDESNYRQWTGTDEKNPEEYAKQMEMYLDPLLEGWKVENVIYEVALKEGYSLTCSIKRLDTITDNLIWKVSDMDRGQFFHICLDNHIEESTVKALELNSDSLFICRDIALMDEIAANLALQCTLKII